MPRSRRSRSIKPVHRREKRPSCAAWKWLPNPTSLGPQVSARHTHHPREAAVCREMLNGAVTQSGSEEGPELFLDTR